MSNRVLVSITDLPDWARDEVGQFIGHRKRPHTYVHLHGGQVIFGAVWHDNYKRRIVAYMPPDEENKKARIMHIDSAYYDSLLNATPSEFHAHQGGSLENVPVDGALLSIERGPYGNYVSMYVHEDGPYAHLTQRLSDGQVMTPVQKAVLNMYTGLTSAGRKDALSRYRIPKKLVLMVTKELEDMGYVSIAKNGATRATLEGKQAQEANKPEWSWYKWGEQYDWETRKYKGFAQPILEEYQAKLEAQRA